MKKRLFPLTASGGGGGGSQATLITKTVTENGTYRAESEQADGFSVVTVAVPEPILKTKSITANGSYAASADEADGFSNVVVNVATPQPTLISKSITANGSYSASGDSADGYSSVSVAVPENFEKYHIVATTANGLVNLAITDYVDQATDNYYVGTIVENGVQNLYILTEDGEPVILVPKTITENGSYLPASDNASGYSSVTVSVPEKVLTTKTITTNGAYAASEDSADGYSSLTVSVLPNLGTKTITTNGAYAANEDSLDGYSSLTVSVQPSLGTKTITTNGTYSAQDDSLDGYSSVTVNYDTSPKFKVEYIDMDGELFEPVQEVVAGGQATEPNEIPYFDTDYLEFVEWKASADTTNVQEDIFCLPLYRTLYDETTQQRPTYLMCYFEAEYLSPTFVFGSYNATNFVNAYIDFGDGTMAQAIDAASISHTYESAGNYVVKVWGDKYIIGGSSTAGLFNSDNYNRCLYKAYIGENGRIGEYSFRNCYSLTYFVCPLLGYYQANTRTFAGTKINILIMPTMPLSSNACDNCAAKYILLTYSTGNPIVPSYTFNSCQYLKRINTKNYSFSSFSFGNCYRLETLDLGKTTTLDSSALNGCYHLKELIIPSTVTSIAFGSWWCNKVTFESRQTAITINGISGMQNLKELIFPDTAQTGSALTVIGNAYLEKVYLPLGVYTNISSPLKAHNITVANGYAHSLAMMECNTQSVLRVAQALADLTGETTQTLKLNSYFGHKVFVDNTYVDSNGDVVPAGTTGATTLLDYITNKNWTVTMS